MPRITPSQARTRRLARRAARRTLAAQRNAAHAAHRAERHTIASHLRAMGVDDTTATGMASTLRKKIHGPGTRGFALKDGTRRACTRYTRTQVLAALADYKPRKAAYKAIRSQILDLAA